MATFCYTLIIDGHARSLPSAEQSGVQEAIDHGRLLLKIALDAGLPTSASVAVFEDEGSDDEPLGEWAWSREFPETTWTSAE